MFLLVVFPDDAWYALRVSIFFTGAWWVVFTIPVIFFVKTRPGPPLPDLGLWYKISFSLRRQYAMLKTLKHIPETRRFLLSYFLFSDCYGTIATVAILFAQVELGMKMSSLIVISIITPIGCSFGLIFWRFIQIRYMISSKNMVMLTLGLILCVPLYGMCGYSQVFGFIYPVEIFVVSIFYGAQLGVVQSASRTCFCDVIPPGQESEFFGVYEITDKGSSWMGPLVCGLLFQIFGSMRVAFFYIFAIGAIGFWLTWKTDFAEGAEACRRKANQVKMEAARTKLGVSKIQIQMNAKKFLGVKSGTSTASSAASTASSVVESTVESTVEINDEHPVIAKHSSILNTKMDEITHDDIEGDTTNDLLHRASILHPGEGLSSAIAARRSSSSSSMRLRSRGGGSVSMNHPGVAAITKERSSRRRASAVETLKSFNPDISGRKYSQIRPMSSDVIPESAEES